MAKFLLVLMIVVLGVSGDGKSVSKRDVFITSDWNAFVNYLCEHDMAAWVGIVCTSTTTATTAATSATAASSAATSATAASSAATSASGASSSAASTSGNDNSVSSTSPHTPLESAHWCQFSNGTYVPYGTTFMYSTCDICKCLPSRAIACSTLQCMPTYCIDGSTPSPKPGQCCPQCAYENTSTACLINGVNFPHGTLLRRSSDNVQCWCQLGSVECRKATVSLFSGLDYFGDGTAVYVIIIILAAMIFFGTLLCCGTTIFFYYYYYQRQQQNAQDLTQYYMNSGWQPMSEDGQVADESAEQKQAEAEQAQYEYEYPTGNSEEFIPPPYALYNGSFVNEPSEKDQKFM